MKAFLVGLLFILGVIILAGIGFLLSPLLLLMVFFLRIIVVFVLVCFAVWLLGKFIIYVWEKIRD